MRKFPALLALTGLASLHGAAPEAPKHLLLDATLVQSSRNVAIEIGPVKKFRGNPFFGEEYPWEPFYANMYTSVIWDEDAHVYKCWYNLFDVYQVDWDRATKENRAWHYRQNALGYAVSGDGVHWRKPLSADFPFDGQPSNVLVRGVSGIGVMKDARETDPARRYKALLRRDEGGQPGTLAVAYSADGLHWSAPADIPHLNLRADTHNNALWAPTLRKYVAFSRDWGPAQTVYPEGSVAPVLNKNQRIRLVARIESSDFVHWSDSQKVMRGLDDIHQVYAMPVFYYAGVYLGFPAIYNILDDRVHTELAWSKDTVTWQRISPGRPLIGNAPTAGYDWGCIYQSPPIIEREQIRLYYGGSDSAHTGFRRTHLCLATLRPDGFAGAEPADSSLPGELTTVAVPRVTEKELFLSADLQAGGSIQAILLDPADGREIGRAETVSGERQLTDAPIPFHTLKGFRSGSVKLRFLLFKAKLYAFKI